VTDTPNPNSCRHCEVDREEHLQRWHPDAGWHTWIEPTSEQRKARMLTRRTPHPITEELNMSTPAELAGLLREHVAETVTQADDGTVLVDCSCGAAVHGAMPTESESTLGALMHVMAEHLAAVVYQAV
jgi:hypothetical protein